MITNLVPPNRPSKSTLIWASVLLLSHANISSKSMIFYSSVCKNSRLRTRNVCQDKFASGGGRGWEGFHSAQTLYVGSAAKVHTMAVRNEYISILAL